MPPQLNSAGVASAETNTDVEPPPVSDASTQSESREILPWAPFVRVPTNWGPDIALGACILVITWLLTWPSPVVHFDTWVRRFFITNQNDQIHDFAYLITYLGSGRFIAPLVLLAAIWLALRHGSVRPMLLYTLCYLPLGLILGLKHIFGRMLSHRPYILHDVTAGQPGAVLFEYYGTATAYPSGHAANSIVWYACLIMLVGHYLPKRVRLLILIAPPTLMFLAQNYVGQHWLSDVPAGIIFGLLIMRGIKRVPWAEVPLGPLASLEPVSPATMIKITALIGGLLFAATLADLHGVIVGTIVMAIGVGWLLNRHFRVTRKKQ